MVVMLDLDQVEIADLRLMVQSVAVPMVDIEKWDHHHAVQNMIAIRDIVRVEIAAAMRDLDRQNIVLITVISVVVVDRT
jgi:midasin (ATPase involved in ribosome maturation)